MKRKKPSIRIGLNGYCVYLGNRRAIVTERCDEFCIQFIKLHDTKLKKKEKKAYDYTRDFFGKTFTIKWMCITEECLNGLAQGYLEYQKYNEGTTYTHGG